MHISNEHLDVRREVCMHAFFKLALQMCMFVCVFVFQSLCSECAYVLLKFKFLSFDAEHATGVEWQCRVHAVKLQWVRRSGKFGGAEAEQKEWNLASLLGSERFLLASSQKVILQCSTAPKVISCSCWWITCKECCAGNMKTHSNLSLWHCACFFICLFKIWIKHLTLMSSWFWSTPAHTQRGQN